MLLPRIPLYTSVSPQFPVCVFCLCVCLCVCLFNFFVCCWQGSQCTQVYLRSFHIFVEFLSDGETNGAGHSSYITATSQQIQMKNRRNTVEWLAKIQMKNGRNTVKSLAEIHLVSVFLCKNETNYDGYSSI